MIEVLYAERVARTLVFRWDRLDFIQTEVCATRRHGDESDRFDSDSGFEWRDSRRVATPPRFRVFGSRVVERRHALAIRSLV